MTTMLELMLQPLVACLILAGMHAYLGMHVVKREVIFVDLALAQVSALGATVAFLFDYDLHSLQGFWFGLAFTLLGAAVFSFTRSRNPIVPQEALIGCVYAISAAAAILVLSRAPEGGEELKAILVGNLLFVEWSDIGFILLVYVGVGAVHWFARKQLLLISEDPTAAFDQGMHVRFWDFVFYGTFGLVVTNSVHVAGVLLVFALLIVPSLCGMFLADSVSRRLAVGWAVGVVTSFVGIYASFQWDLPTGATVVCAFGVSLVVCGVASKLLGRTGAAH